jgi:hypothetical protein
MIEILRIVRGIWRRLSLFFFLISKRIILLTRRKAHLSTLGVYRENTYVEREKRVRKLGREKDKGCTKAEVQKYKER